MKFDDAAAAQFFAYTTGEASLDSVWTHPAYKITRRHASLLGQDFSKADIREALNGTETPFGQFEDLSSTHDRVDTLRTHVADVASDWQRTADQTLTRVTPDADLASIPVHLGVGYSFGIGLQDGAYLNLNEPLFAEDPRQLLYAAIHESSHVVYDRLHSFSDELSVADLGSIDGQQRVFATLFHTEAFATYTPLSLRRSDGAMGEHDHLVSRDYAVLSDTDRLAALVEEYDASRDRLAESVCPPDAVLEPIYGPSRLPYRVGCALLMELERERGLDAVQEAFTVSPQTFLSRYDSLLDQYRTSS